ncbi:unnamed protein product, partial [Meganyctiphanes norvegica]
MNDMGSDENCDDEFECSECDFKCTSEIDIIQHSAMHQYPSNANDDVLHNSAYDTYNEGGSKEDDPVATLQAKVYSDKEIVACNRLAETSEINALDPYKFKVKREQSSHEVISTTKIIHESEIGNKIIKLEDMDIKQEFCPNYSSNLINEYGNIHLDQDSLGIGSMPSKNRLIYGRESMHFAYNNVNISTEDESLSDKTIVEYGSIFSQRDPLHIDMSLTNSSQSLPPHKTPHGHKSSIEVEIDNTGVYIPPGWDRKVYMRPTLNNGQLKYDCYYYTESGKQICSKKFAYEYCSNKKHLENIDIEKLNFSVSKTTMKPDQPTLEVDLDNTGIYIPKGWQRKIYHNGQQMYNVNYINAEGIRFGCKSYVYAYQSNSDSNKEKQIDVEELDFSRGIRSRLSLNMGCQSVQVQNKIMTKRFRHSEYENYQIIEFLFEVRKIVQKAKEKKDNLYLCKLCNFSSRIQHVACCHASIHLHKFSNESIQNSVLPNNYDYFMCTDCQFKIMKRKDVQIHLKGHCSTASSRQITNTVVSVKLVCAANSKVNKILYCCEVCEFACFRCSFMVKHLKYHTHDEIVTADRDKYYNNKYKCDGSGLVSIYKYGSSDYTERIGGINSEIKLYNHGIKHRNTSGKIEIKVDNAGKYIPEGWQRKVYKLNKGVLKGKHRVGYISSLGRTLYSKTQVSKYIEKLKSNGIIELINLDKMDFSGKSHIQKRNSVGKIEIQVDNTGIYIPEGWQRKVFRYTMGIHKNRCVVRYISPLGRTLGSRTQVSDYIEKLESNGIIEHLDVDKLDFSPKSHRK